MEYTKPIPKMMKDLKRNGVEIYRRAMTGEQCAQMFAEFDRSNPDIHELIDRLQFASGNDRYSVMMDQIERTGVHAPWAFYSHHQRLNVQRGMQRC